MNYTFTKLRQSCGGSTLVYIYIYGQSTTLDAHDSAEPAASSIQPATQANPVQPASQPPDLQTLVVSVRPKVILTISSFGCVLLVVP